MTRTEGATPVPVIEWSEDLAALFASACWEDEAGRELLSALPVGVPFTLVQAWVRTGIGCYRVPAYIRAGFTPEEAAIKDEKDAPSWTDLLALADA